MFPLADNVVVEVDLIINLLRIDRLKEVATLTLSLLTFLLVQLFHLNELTISIHVQFLVAFPCFGIFELILQEKVIFLLSSISVLKLKELLSILRLIFTSERLKFGIHIKAESLESKEFHHEEVDLGHVSLLDVIFVTESFVQHISDLLNKLKIVVGKNMRQLDHSFSTIADDLVEHFLFLVGHNLHHGSKYKTEEHVNHGNSWQSSSGPTEEAASFVVIVFASKGDLVDVEGIKFISEVVDRVHIEVNVVLPVKSFKSELVQEVRSSELFTLKFLLDFFIREVHLLGSFATVRHDA